MNSRYIMMDSAYKSPEKGQKPQPPLHYSQQAASVMKSGLYGLSSFSDYPRPQYIQIDDYTYLYMKYETDLARWERDEANNAFRKLRDNLNENYQTKLKEQEIVVKSATATVVYNNNNEIKALKEELAKKKQLECFHEYDIAVDPEYWKKIKDSLNRYKETTIVLSGIIGMLVVTLVWLVIAIG